MKATTATLEPRTVGSISGEFFIPAYQRGYRWGEQEVRLLLDDITEAAGGDYYLQPVVVKQLAGGDRSELVDGQQRLTTLYLILRAIKRYLPFTELPYSLSYETRPGSATYLDNPTEDGSLENIDYFHIYAASQCIDAWFASRPNPTTAAMKLYEGLTESVRVIWYEAPSTEEFDSRTLFTRLNIGQIPLTDAELVKAFLLSRVERQFETAAQWDSIERDLRAPQVWAFATGQPDGGATRISLLLDTLADAEDDNVHDWHVRPAFRTFETLRPLIVKDGQALWDRVVDLHSLILGWHDDRDLFHKIGYLVAARRATFSALVRDARGTTKTEFHARLDRQIRDSLRLSANDLAALTYQSTKTSRVLLLMNAETVRRNTNSSERYSFDAHAQRLWSREHIHAQNSQGLNTVDQWTTWLKEHRDALDALDLSTQSLADIKSRIDIAVPTITAEKFEALHQEITQLFSDAADTVDPDDPGSTEHSEVDSITNLALLASTDNSVLNNSVFEVKRRRVIALDRNGAYIPVCTRNAFLKYYTDAGAQLHFWGPRDRDGYLAAMQTVLAPYLLEDRPGSTSEDEEEITL
ncbi:DUF262 domain-containing protein [Terracoccus luteus]|uniref:DUF262 domain-containing protein n=1 Tax=Terracoccus luteus TaxID=53356 RepID=UPI001475D32B|nr:DUF262 domain-containing protein [Terracoccus luteus]